MPSFAHTPLHLRTWKTEIEPVRQRKLSTRAVPICCAKARACFRRTLTRCIVLLTERTCSSVPSWPNNQKIAGSSPAGTWCAIVLILVVPKTTDVAKVGESSNVATRKCQNLSCLTKVLLFFVLQKQKSRCAAARPTLKYIFFFFFVCVCVIDTLPPLFLVLSRTRHASRSHEADAQ